MFSEWTALDMALCLELALQKGENVLENVSFTLHSLASKSFRQEDEGLPQNLIEMASMPDPVDITRQVVDNFYSAFVSAEQEFMYVEEASLVQDQVCEEQVHLLQA